MTANAESGELLGSINFDLYGNDSNNNLYGNSAINTLSGLGGDDTLFYSGDGFHGGGDTLDGGEGNDSASFANETAAVTASLAAGSATGGSGADTLVSIENLIGGSGDDRFTGDDNANRLYGGGGSDILTGGGGADFLSGGSGDDAYDVDNVGDVVAEGMHRGTDYVTAAISYTLGANVENLTLYGYAGNIKGTGNNLDNVIIGNRGNNVLRGLDGNDYLFGGDLGDDTLDGGAGADTMDGGAGNDTHYVDNAADKVIEAASGGTDTVFASVNWTLGAGQEVEYLRVNGSAGRTLTGNEFNNKLIGGAGGDRLNGGLGADFLDGRAGADRMFGGAGNDIYYVDDLGDVVREATATGVDDGGTDLVNSSVSYVLGSFVEKLSLTGGDAIDGTGNGLDNVITGNSGVNHLYGGGGDDKLTVAATPTSWTAAKATTTTPSMAPTSCMTTAAAPTTASPRPAPTPWRPAAASRTSAPAPTPRATSA